MINKLYVLSFSSLVLLILLCINIFQIERHQKKLNLSNSNIMNLKKIYSSNYLDNVFLQEAYIQAQISLSEGGIPIGSVLVVEGKIIGRGHNQRIQKSNPILHGEMDALQNAGRQNPEVYRKSILYTTLSPCAMCTGAILFYKIPRVVIGDNKNFNAFSEGEDLLREKGVEVINMNDVRCEKVMKDYIENNSKDWEEDISRCKNCKKHKNKDYQNIYDNFNYNRETNQEIDQNNNQFISLNKIQNCDYSCIENCQEPNSLNSFYDCLKSRCECPEEVVESIGHIYFRLSK